MRRRALEIYGQDEPASAIPPAGSFPATSAPFALELASVWHRDIAPRVVRRAAALAGDGDWTGCSAIADVIAKGLAAGELDGAIDYPIAGRIAWPDALAKCGAVDVRGLFRGLKEMYGAIKIGALSRRETADGRLIMDPYSVRWFWDGMSRCQIDASGIALTGIEVNEGWRRFKDEAKETARAVADAAGEAAGFALATAGEALGKGVGSLLEELGVVKVAALGLGAYAAWRIL